MSLQSIKALKCLIPVLIMISMTAHSIALFTNQWLFSEEKMPNTAYIKFNMSADLEYLSKFTVSGLWVLCQNELGLDAMNCTKIDYFSNEEYTPDPSDSTMAIPYAAKKAAFFILFSTAVFLFGVIFEVLGSICRKKHVFNFAAGISLILSGLFILAGIVIYISTFKTEIGNKLRPKSSFQEAKFKYKYGMSFMFAIASLMICELAGTFSVFLYIRLHQSNWKKKFKKHQKYVNFVNNDSSFSSKKFPFILDPSALFSPPLLPSSIVQHCTKHSGRGRRFSRSKDLSDDSSQISFKSKSSKTPSFTVSSPNIHISESMHNLNYYKYPNKLFTEESSFQFLPNMEDTNQDLMKSVPNHRNLIFKKECPLFVREKNREYLTYKDYSNLFRTTPV